MFIRLYSRLDVQKIAWQVISAVRRSYRFLNDENSGTRYVNLIKRIFHNVKLVSTAECEGSSLSRI
jgi:hypothetical protein